METVMVYLSWHYQMQKPPANILDCLSNNYYSKERMDTR